MQGGYTIDMKVFYIVALLVLIWFTLTDKRGKLFPVALVVAVMTIIYAFCVDVSDLGYYHSFYDTISYDNIIYINFNASSVVFSYIFCFLKQLGLSFAAAKAVLFGVLMIASLVSLNKQTDISFMVIFYAVIIFFFDVVQMRFFVAEMLLLIGLHFLLENKRVAFIICILLIAYTHTMLAIFGLLILIPTKKVISRRKAKMLFGLSFLLIIFGALNGGIIELFQQIVSSIEIFSEYAGYMVLKVRNGYILYIIYQVANIVLAYHLNKIMNDNAESIERDSLIYRFNNLNYNVQIIGILFVIATMVDINFSRYFRIFTIINLLTLGVYKRERYNSMVDYEINSEQPKFGVIRLDKDEEFELIIFIIIVVMWFIGETYINHSMSNIAEKVFAGFRIL